MRRRLRWWPRNKQSKKRRIQGIVMSTTNASPNVSWFIPPHGDSRYLGTSKGARPVDADYTRQVAVAADTLGYDGVLLPTGRSCEDPWIVASSLIHATRNLK